MKTPPTSGTVANNGLSPHNHYNTAVPSRHLAPPGSSLVDSLLCLQNFAARTFLFLCTDHPPKLLETHPSLAVENAPPDPATLELTPPK